MVNVVFFCHCTKISGFDKRGFPGVVYVPMEEGEERRARCGEFVSFVSGKVILVNLSS